MYECEIITQIHLLSRIVGSSDIWSGENCRKSEKSQGISFSRSCGKPEQVVLSNWYCVYTKYRIKEWMDEYWVDKLYTCDMVFEEVAFNGCTNIGLINDMYVIWYVRDL